MKILIILAVICTRSIWALPTNEVTTKKYKRSIY